MAHDDEDEAPKHEEEGGTVASSRHDASFASLDELLEGVPEPKDAAWKRKDGEPSNWYKRFSRFRLMQPDRRITKVFREEEQAAVASGRSRPARKLPNGTWYEMADSWQWELRAEAWDTWVQSILEKHLLRAEAKVLTSGLALMHRRIEMLETLAYQLHGYTLKKDLVWLPDVKAISNGPTKPATKVDLIRFNAELFGQLRGMLDDIAAEKGERVKVSKSELTGKDGADLNVGAVQNVFYDVKVMVEPEPEDTDEAPGADVAADTSEEDEYYDEDGEYEDEAQVQ